MQQCHYKESIPVTTKRFQREDSNEKDDDATDIDHYHHHHDDSKSRILLRRPNSAHRYEEKCRAHQNIVSQ